MAKFMYLFRGGDGRMAELSSEEKQKHMDEWRSWMSSLAEQGTFIDGLPLGREAKVVKGNDKLISDGPYTEGKEIVGGYLIVKAENLEQATEISKGCPIFKWDTGIVEVREIMDMDVKHGD